MSVPSAALPDFRAGSAGRVSLLTGETALRAIERAASQSALGRAGNIFHSPGMIRAAAENAACLAACIVRDGSIETVWPLRLTRDIGVSMATDLCDPISQYSDVIGTPMEGADIIELAGLLRRDHKVDTLLARRVRADSGLDAAFRNAGAAIVDAGLAPYADLAAFGDFASYMAHFSKSTIRKIRQRRARLEAEVGALSFDVLQGDAARDAVRMSVLWKRYWLDKQAYMSRVFDGAENEKALIDAATGPNAFTSVLSAGGRPVAIELGFAAGTHYAAYLGTFAPSFASYSAGQEQMLRTIEWCFAQRFTHYDLLPPDDNYKRHWTRGDTTHAVHDYGVATSRAGDMHLFVRRHARARVQRTLEMIPMGLRQVVKRYGPAAIGAGAAAVAIGLLND